MLLSRDTSRNWPISARTSNPNRAARTDQLDEVRVDVDGVYVASHPCQGDRRVAPARSVLEHPKPGGRAMTFTMNPIARSWFETVSALFV